MKSGLASVESFTSMVKVGFLIQPSQDTFLSIFIDTAGENDYLGMRLAQGSSGWGGQLAAESKNIILCGETFFF